jgi:hypothetical protein
MRDPGASAQPRQPGDSEASSARATERASKPGTARLRSNSDAQAEAAVPKSPQSDAERRADRASRETENIAGKSGDHTERKDGKRHQDAKAADSVAELRTPDRCTIVYERSHRQGAFEVVVTDPDGSRRSVARSPAFRARSSAVSRWRRAARLAHSLLVWRLEACGWRSVGSGETWHDLRFVRARPAGMRSMRSVVTLVREAGRARFVAEELDSYGNPTPLLVSPAFAAQRFLPVRPSRRATAALRQLVMRMESEGWKVAATVGNDWYAISLWRAASATRASRASGPRLRPPAAEPA